MTLALRQIADRVYLVTVSGLLTWAEFQASQVRSETENIFATGKLKALVQLDDFAGWEPGEQWGDVGFFFRHDRDVEKIAVVGDPRWRDEALLFLFADSRHAEVRFFPEADLELARAWLMG